LQAHEAGVDDPFDLADDAIVNRKPDLVEGILALPAPPGGEVDSGVGLGGSVATAAAEQHARHDLVVLAVGRAGVRVGVSSGFHGRHPSCLRGFPRDPRHARAAAFRLTRPSAASWLACREAPRGAEALDVRGGAIVRRRRRLSAELA
jgi:hypothetical protein